MFRSQILLLAFLSPLMISAASEPLDTNLTGGENIVKDVIATLNLMYPTDQTLTDKQKKENDKFKEKIGSYLDIDTMTEMALATHMTGKSTTDLSTFKDLFKQVLVRSATNRTTSKKVQIEIKRTKYNPKKNIEVTTKVKRKGDDPMMMKYEIKTDSTGKLKIIDLVLDEESQMQNYQSNFDEILKKNDFNELLKRLKNHLAKKPPKKGTTEKI